MGDDVGLDRATRAELRRLLAAERQATAGQIAGLDRTFADLVEASEVEPADDEHDPDGTTAYERAQVSSLARVARQRLVALDRALERVDQRDFGTCASCGGPIGVERLLAVPEADRCVACASGAPPAR